MIVLPYCSGSVILNRFESIFRKENTVWDTAWEIRCQIFEKSAWSVHPRKWSLNCLNFLLEPGLLIFTALMKQKRRIFVKFSQHHFVYLRLKSRMVCEWSRWKRKLLRCKNWVRMQKLVNGSRWIAYIGQNHPFWTWKNPKQQSVSPVGDCKKS